MVKVFTLSETNKNKLLAAAQAAGIEINVDEIKTLKDYKEAWRKLDESSKKSNTHDNQDDKTTSDEHPKTQHEENKKEKQSTTETLTVGELTSQEAQPQNQGQEEDWIRIKAEYYESIKAELKDYERDVNVAGFAASFNGAKIHYTAENNVQVSKEAGIEVFERMLSEPGNDTKMINFSANMPQEMAARLLAACILKGNKITGNVPDITDEVKKIIKDTLTAENANTAEAKYKEFEEKLAARTAQNAENAQSQVQTEQNHDENVAALQKMRAQFNKMKEDGLIKIVEENGKPQIVAGNDSPEAKEAAIKAENIMKEAAELVKAGKYSAIKIQDKEQRDTELDKYNQERISMLRSARTDEQNKVHDDKESERNAFRKQMAVQMGILPADENIKDNNGNKVEKLPDDKIDTNSLLYARLQKRFGNTQS